MEAFVSLAIFVKGCTDNGQLGLTQNRSCDHIPTSPVRAVLSSTGNIILQDLELEQHPARLKAGSTKFK